MYMQTVNNIIVAADEPVGLNLTWSQVHKTCTNTEGGGGGQGGPVFSVRCPPVLTLAYLVPGPTTEHHREK